MADSFTIAVDAMGGDNAPDAIVAGTDMALERYPNLKIILVGDERRIQPLVEKTKRLQDALINIVHTDEAVSADMKPSQAIRGARGSSMRLAIDLVSDGAADGIISAGNTGALMALAKFVLKTQPGIARPAIASFFPTQRGESVMLDLGANLECSVTNLVQFAVMGAVFANTVLGRLKPSIGLLNVGAEEQKGNDTIKEAAATLKEMSLPGSFHGFIEGNDIASGTTDVVVTDGFTGNVALKTAEGTAQLYSSFLRNTFSASWMARAGYLLARPAFLKLKTRTDPRRYNGGVLLGLRAICVKSHGGTDAVGFCNAMGVAHDLLKEQCIAKIEAGIGALPADLLKGNASTNGDDQAGAAKADKPTASVSTEPAPIAEQ
ncbi:MAG: phosphate acyltransferase PlsX [Pseudomonadota bacterium]